MSTDRRTTSVFVQQQRGPGKRREAAAALALQHLLSTGNIFSRARKCHCLIGLVWFNESGFLSQWEGAYFERRYKRRSARRSHSTRRRWAHRNGRPLLSYTAALSHFTSTCCKVRVEKMTHKTHRCSHGPMSFPYSALSSSFGPMKERKHRNLGSNSTWTMSFYNVVLFHWVQNILQWLNYIKSIIYLYFCVFVPNGGGLSIQFRINLKMM